MKIIYDLNFLIEFLKSKFYLQTNKFKWKILDFIADRNI